MSRNDMEITTTIRFEEADWDLCAWALRLFLDTENPGGKERDRALLLMAKMQVLSSGEAPHG